MANNATTSISKSTTYKYMILEYGSETERYATYHGVFDKLDDAVEAIFADSNMLTVLEDLDDAQRQQMKTDLANLKSITHVDCWSIVKIPVQDLVPNRFVNVSTD